MTEQLQAQISALNDRISAMNVAIEQRFSSFESQLNLLQSEISAHVERTKASFNVQLKVNEQHHKLVQNLATDKSFISVLLGKMIEEFNKVESQLHDAGAFDFKIEYTDDPVNENSMKLVLGFNPENPTEPPYTLLRLNESNEWAPLDDDPSEDVIALRDGFRNSAISNGYKEGDTLYVTVSHKLIEDAQAGLSGNLNVGDVLNEELGKPLVNDDEFLDEEDHGDLSGQ